MKNIILGGATAIAAAAAGGTATATAVGSGAVAGAVAAGTGATAAASATSTAVAVGSVTGNAACIVSSIATGPVGWTILGAEELDENELSWDCWKKVSHFLKC